MLKKRLQLIKKRNSSDIFVLINRHKHIYYTDKDNAATDGVHTTHHHFGSK